MQYIAKKKLWENENHTLKIKPTMVVPVFKKEGALSPFCVSISFLLQRSKLNPPFAETSTVDCDIWLPYKNKSENLNRDLRDLKNEKEVQSYKKTEFSSSPINLKDTDYRKKETAFHFESNIGRMSYLLLMLIFL